MIRVVRRASGVVFVVCCITAMLEAGRTEAESCLGNVVANADFSSGLVYGSMPAASVSNWSLITQSPQVVNSGCATTAGAIQMWGNLVVGESIKQSLTTPFVAGKTYRITVRYKLPLPGPAPQDLVRFRLAASPGTPTVYPPTGGASYDVIGLTPLTSSATCVTYTFPDWTAPRNASWLAINPENTSSVNDGAQVSWGTIDDICISEVKCDAITNGNFSAGLVYGSMPAASVSNWSLISESPQVVNSGCATAAGALQMWGNLVVGESVKQSLTTPFVAGTTYRITIRYKLPLPGPAPQDSVRFRLAASPNTPTVYPPTGGAAYDVIGITPLTASGTCISYTFPDWTAPRNASWIAINPENKSSVNDGAQVSWGTIDDICIDAVSTSTAVPGASTWAVGLLSLAMAGAGCVFLRRRSVQRNAAAGA